ncbi:MAG TPA: hypothetical protein VNM14_26055 [Planctomycetota bacterium]|nr:hypothetical protein [Planctomycetota bacterium]
MSATSRNAWLIPVGSFVIAVLLALLSGPAIRAAARMPQQQSETDVCHEPTKKDGKDDAGGKSDGKHFKTADEGVEASANYTIDFEFFFRKANGYVRYSAGAKNGASVPGLEKKKNDTMRGWKLIHGMLTSDCCHTATQETNIRLQTFATIPKPTVAGKSEVVAEAEVTMDQFADNCAANRPLKKKPTRSIRLTATRQLSSNGILTDQARGFDSDSTTFVNLQFNADGLVFHRATLTGTDNWFFREKTDMKYEGTATLEKVVSGPGAGQRAEGMADVFASISTYGVADNGNLNSCSN